jgi:peptidoglycan/LPS O-acetylase OafA/YrhL
MQILEMVPAHFAIRSGPGDVILIENWDRPERTPFAPTIGRPRVRALTWIPKGSPQVDEGAVPASVAGGPTSIGARRTELSLGVDTRGPEEVPRATTETLEGHSATIRLETEPVNRTEDLQRAPWNSRLGYRPELDGMRGIAIALVVSLHIVNWPPGGFLGVDAFFTLSGFLITTLLLEEWEVHGAISLRKFYLRRIFRLFPALACLLIVYSVFAVILGGSARNLRLQGALYGLTYVANWIQAIDLPFPKEELGYVWSLAIEEQFYLLWPLTLIFLLKVGGVRPNRMKLILVAIILSLVAWRTFLSQSGVSGPRLYFGTDARLDQLLVGCLLGVLFTTRLKPSVGSWRLNVAAVLALGFLGWRVFGGNYWVPWLFTGGLTLISIAVAILIYVCVTGSFPLLNRLLSLKWLVFVGTISYSLYLWHVPVTRAISGTPLEQLGWVTVGVKASLSVAAACASYYLIELPFLRKKRNFQRLRSARTYEESTADVSIVGRHTG